jgi:hypothetical protein
MAVGFPAKTTYANGDVFSASDINDTNGTLNLAAGAPWAAGKNKIINGAFNVWQRGTSFTLTTGVASYTADRFMVQCNFSSGSSTATQQTFTPGTAPVAGYENQFFLRITNSAGGTNTELQQRVEDVRTYAGQTVTISFWAKASSAVTMANTIIQNFGSGGSGSVSTTGTSQTLTTSWARYSTTITVPSVSGKTIGTSSYLQVYPMYYSSGTIASNVIDVWGVQLEAGSTATPFQTATGTIQGELAACQRYYWNATTANNTIGAGVVSSSTNAFISVKYPQTMRIVPTLTFATAATLEQAGSAAVTAASIAVAGTDGAGLSCTSSGMTTGRGAILYVTTGSFQFSSEL